MNNISKDPIMLMSWLNLKLRDFYPDLDSLCDDLELDRQDIEERMKAAGFEYSEEHRKFW